jgi:hypothetical protein
MYLDPGFGGMLLQVLVAIAAAGGVLLYSIRRKLRALFSRSKENSTSQSTSNADTTDIDTGKSGDDVVDMLSDDETVDT